MMDHPLVLLGTICVIWLAAYFGNLWIDRAEQRRIARHKRAADQASPAESWNRSGGNYHPESDPNRGQERRR